MAYRKYKGDLEQAIDDFKQASLYIKTDAYESIMSDYKYFFGINERNLNDFINELTVNLIEYSVTNQDIIIVNSAELLQNKKSPYGSGKVLRFRSTKILNNVLKETETSHNSIVSDNKKRDSIANVFIEEHGDLFNDEPSYSSYIKRFIDLLLNKYGALPTHKREAIYFRHKHTIITECIAKHRRIRIKTNGEEFIIKPYSLLVDPSVRYLYLTGYVDDKICSFRFSRITISSLDNRFDDNNGDLTYKEKEQIKNRILGSGVAYLSEKVIDNIEVLLTEYGYYLYSEVIIHQRPDLKESGTLQDPIEELPETEIDQFRKATGFEYTKRIHCSCTKRQARLYFSRFGSEAVIITPRDLSEECRKFADDASKAYNGILEQST